ncbi:hypothetical protein D5086_023052 [Populus alba]|uniref:Uncharacterized protein n=1 Tax=Populus alba TaxID=43335 RepID=A0ACC4B9B3_POPAL
MHNVKDRNVINCVVVEGNFVVAWNWIFLEFSKLSRGGFVGCFWADFGVVLWRMFRGCLRVVLWVEDGVVLAGCGEGPSRVKEVKEAVITDGGSRVVPGLGCCWSREEERELKF